MAGFGKSAWWIWRHLLPPSTEEVCWVARHKLKLAGQLVKFPPFILLHFLAMFKRDWKIWYALIVSRVRFRWGRIWVESNGLHIEVGLWYGLLSHQHLQLETLRVKAEGAEGCRKGCVSGCERCKVLRGHRCTLEGSSWIIVESFDEMDIWWKLESNNFSTTGVCDQKVHNLWSVC